jgi:hypothetical protein
VARTKKPKGGYVAGQGTGPAIAAQLSKPGGKKTAAKDTTVTEELVKQRHEDWTEHELFWRRAQDSYEGGDRYRNAVYGMTREGLPVRNLFRHPREYPDPQKYANNQTGMAGYGGGGNAGSDSFGIGQSGIYPGMVGADAGATANDDTYETRRSKTPCPGFVREVIGIWLGKVYDQEITRVGPPEIEKFWKDCDGCGTPMDDYMLETIAPLLLSCGQIDTVLDRPRVPAGEQVKTKADEARLGLNKVVISYILPENNVWWRTDTAARFTECLIREYVDAADRTPYDGSGDPLDDKNTDAKADSWRGDNIRWRHWTTEGSTLYSYDGKEVEEDTIKHPYGRVPIPRLVDQKKLRTRMIGQSRIAMIIDEERLYYNKNSELILSDTLQAHPFLSGPEDYCKADNTLSVGPGYLLPKKKNPESGDYEGFEYVSPPKDPAASLRQNMLDIRDKVDRLAGLTKPAGATGTTGATVSQSGISKQLDAVEGTKILSDICRSLAKAERIIAEYAYMVLHNGKLPAEDLISIGYPTNFNLKSTSELLGDLALLQQCVGAAGNLPNVEEAFITAAYKQALVGFDDEAYRILDTEIQRAMQLRSTIVETVREMNMDALSKQGIGGSGTSESGAQEDNTGQSNSTLVSGSLALGGM